MKIKLADIPINIIDGIDKYPRASIGIFCFLAGSLAISALSGELAVFAACSVGVFAALCAAWYAGKPKS